MNIEALNTAISGSISTGATNFEEKVNKENSSVNKDSFLNVYRNAIGSVIDDSSFFEEDNTTSDSDGWRSNAYSFFSGNVAITNNKFNHLDSLSINLDETLNATIDNTVSSLQTQLSEAKSELSRLEAEKTACAKKEKSTLMAYMISGGKVDANVISAATQKSKSYKSKINMQKATISSLEAQLSKISEQQ